MLLSCNSFFRLKYYHYRSILQRKHARILVLETKNEHSNYEITLTYLWLCLRQIYIKKDSLVHNNLYLGHLLQYENGELCEHLLILFINNTYETKFNSLIILNIRSRIINTWQFREVCLFSMLMRMKHVQSIEWVFMYLAE